jgi:hypothetical protein
MCLCPWRGSHAEGKHECTCKGVNSRCRIGTAAAQQRRPAGLCTVLTYQRRAGVRNGADAAALRRKMLQLPVNAWLQAVREQ